MSDTAHPAAAAAASPEAEAAFWDWCEKGELRIQRCLQCLRWIYFPAPRCYICLSDRLEWQSVSGRGEIYSATVVYHAASPELHARLPYVVAWVELPEQKNLRILANIVGCAPGDVRIGQAVEVAFAEFEAGALRAPRFRPLERTDPG